MSSYYDDASLMLLASGGAQKDGKVYSVKPTDGSGDFTFTRGSNLSATRVDASQLIEKGRENLFIYSNDFNSGWSPKAGTFTQGVTDPNGGSTAWSWTATNTDPYLYQYWGFSGVHCISVWAKGVGSTIGDDIELRIGGSINYFTLTSEWKRFEAFAVLNGATNIGFEYGQPATSGDVIHIYGAQLELGLVATPYIETGASTAQAGILENTPRFDYSGGATCPSLLLEPSRTNTFINSEYFAAWNSSNVSLTTNSITSPQGVVNASSLTDDAVNSRHRINVSDSFTSGTSYTVSVFVKKNSSNRFLLINASTAFNARAALNLDTLEITNINGTKGKIEDYGNGWYRFSVSGQATNTTSQNIYMQMQNTASDSSYVGDGSSFYLWGAQLEQGSYPTSYIPTYGVSQTRAQDICNGAGDVNTFNSTEGVLYTEISALSNDGANRAISIYKDSSLDNLINIQYNSVSQNIRYLYRQGVSSIADLNFVVSDITSVHKIAGSWANNNFRLFVDGVKVGEQLSGNVAPANTFITLGFNRPDGQLFEGKAKEVIVFKEALSDLDLAILTGATTYNTFAAMALALNYTVYE